MNEKRERIELLLITTLFPNSQEPNRGIFNYHLVKELQDWCNVTVIAPIPWFPKANFLRHFSNWHRTSQLRGKEQIRGIDVYHPRYLAIPKLSGFLRALSLYFTLERVIRKIRGERSFDLINAHWIFPDGVAAVKVSKKLRLPIIVTGHGTDVNLYLTYSLRRVQIRDALQKTDVVSVVSPELKKKIVELSISEHKVRVIPNGVDSERFTPTDKASCRRRLGLPSDRKIVLFVGKLDTVKGIEYLLEATAEIRAACQNLFIAIVGDGPLYQSLIRKTQELDLTGLVTFFGAKPHEEIPLWMNSCDLFCLPSLREGWPCVIMEALACGKPVVASRVGGVPEIVNEKNGFLVEPRNSKDLAQGIERALERSWDIREILTTVNGFSWKASAQEYHAMYHELLDARQV